MIKVGLIGYGYWGKNVARILSQSDIFELYSIFDISKDRLNESLIYKHKIFSSYEELLKDDNIESIFIVTKTITHFALAKQALQAKKHVFVEKPLTCSLKDSMTLYNLASKNQVALYCDYVFMHSPSVIALKQNMPNFGEILSVNADRLFGACQDDVSVIQDLAIHDISIFEYLFDFKIKSFKVYSKDFKGYKKASSTMLFILENNMHISLNVSWISPFKIRHMIILSSNLSARYDDTIKHKLVFNKTSTFNTLDKDLVANLPSIGALDLSIKYFGLKVLSFLDKLKASEIIQAQSFSINIPSNLSYLDKLNMHIPLNDDFHSQNIIKIIEKVNK